MNFEWKYFQDYWNSLWKSFISFLNIIQYQIVIVNTCDHRYKIIRESSIDSDSNKGVYNIKDNNNSNNIC